MAKNRANLNIFFNNDFSNFKNIDYGSVMYIDYPKSWLVDPSNYEQRFNSNLSQSDRALMVEKYQNLNYV